MIDFFNSAIKLVSYRPLAAKISVLAVAALLLCGVIFLCSTKKPIRINRPLGAFGLVFAAFTIICSILFTDSDILLIHTNGDPGIIVEQFYSNIEKGNYSEAYGYLKDYTTLGLENNPPDEYSEKIYSALKNSYSYSLVGEPVITDFTATQTVSFSYLEISNISNDVAGRIEPLLRSRVETLSRREIYDENGDYLTSLLDEVYNIAFDAAMKDSNKYIVTKEYDVYLEYVGNTWLINVNDDMTYCFAGGTR